MAETGTHVTDLLDRIAPWSAMTKCRCGIRQDSSPICLSTSRGGLCRFSMRKTMTVTRGRCAPAMNAGEGRGSTQGEHCPDFPDSFCGNEPIHFRGFRRRCFGFRCGSRPHALPPTHLPAPRHVKDVSVQLSHSSQLHRSACGRFHGWTSGGVAWASCYGPFRVQLLNCMTVRCGRHRYVCH